MKKIIIEKAKYLTGETEIKEIIESLIGQLESIEEQRKELNLTISKQYEDINVERKISQRLAGKIKELKNEKNDYTFQVNLKNRFSVKTDMTEKLIKKVIDALKINCNHEEKILADESFEILNMIRIEEDEISQKLFKRFESKEVK